MSLLDELGIDPEDFDWPDLSLCQDIVITGPKDDIFFDRYESDVETAKAADEMCLRCPVQKECFFTGSQGNYGLFGGVFWNGSGRPDKNRNAHKTEATWARIHKGVQ